MPYRFSFRFIIALFGALMVPWSPAWGAQCLVVSGVSQDYNKAFARERFVKPETAKIHDTQCKIFDSYEKLLEYAFPADGKKNIQAGEQLAIGQFAHGSPGGSAVCNDGVASPDTIINALIRLAEKFQVGAALRSCFSGDILKTLLLKQRSDPKAKAVVKNLCLVTSSQFGHVSAGPGHPFYEVGRTKNLAEAAVKSEYLSSAAAWDQVGITDYLVTRNSRLAGSILKKMGQFSSTCPYVTDGQFTLQACGSGKVTSQVLNMLADLQSGDARLLQSTLIRGLDIALTETEKEHPQEGFRLNETQKACLNAFKAAVAALRSSPRDITLYVPDVATSLLHDYFEAESNRSCKETVLGVLGHIPEFGVLVRYDQARTDVVRLLLKDKQAARMVRGRNAQDPLRNNLLELVQTVVRVSNATSDARQAVDVCMGQAEMLRAILGTWILGGEHELVVPSSLGLSSGAALNAFNAGSLYHEKEYDKDSIDKKRLDACKSFTWDKFKTKKTEN